MPRVIIARKPGTGGAEDAETVDQVACLLLQQIEEGGIIELPTVEAEPGTFYVSIEPPSDMACSEEVNDVAAEEVHEVAAEEVHDVAAEEVHDVAAEEVHDDATKEVHDVAEDSDDTNNAVQKRFVMKRIPIVNGRDPDRPYGCGACDYNGLTRRNLQKHMNYKHSGKLFHCDYCEYKFKEKGQLVRHLKRHAEQEPFVCGWCDKRFSNYAHLKEHRTVHSEDSPPLVCMTCNYTCKNWHLLERHINTHRTVEFACGDCSFKSEDRLEVEQHVLEHSIGTIVEGPPEVFAECETSTDQSQKIPTRVRTKKKSFDCNLCEYKSPTKRKLDKHMRLHGEEKPYACAVCDYKSARKDHVRLHLMSHTREKPFACEQCQFRAVTATKLKFHMRSHTGEKPYACTFCDYRASRKDYIDSHMKRHTEKPRRRKKTDCSY